MTNENSPCRVEWSNESSAGTFQHQVLAQQLQAGVFVHILGPGSHLGQTVLHSQGHPLDGEGAADTLPKHRASLPPVEVDQDWQQCEGSGVVSPGINIDLTNNKIGK